MKYWNLQALVSTKELSRSLLLTYFTIKAQIENYQQNCSSAVHFFVFNVTLELELNE